MKYFKLFGWTITNDTNYEWAKNNPPKHHFWIPVIKVLIVIW